MFTTEQKIEPIRKNNDKWFYKTALKIKCDQPYFKQKYKYLEIGLLMFKIIVDSE